MRDKIRVLVVDDSAVIRRLVSAVLTGDPEIEVVGTASSGVVALAEVERLNPDVITLDIEMPGMDGIETLRRLRTLRSRIPVIMFSTLTERGASATLEALTLGARDYVTKPANQGSVPESMESVRSQLIPRIKALHTSGRSLLRPRTAAPSPVGTVPRPHRSPPQQRSRPTGSVAGPVEVVLIGSSTGGPDALTEVLAGLPADFGVPVLCVQHMPPVFTRMFAQRLDSRCRLHVKEAEAGDVVRPGTVLIAAGDHHLTLRRQGADVVAVLDQSPAVSYSRPSVDVLFSSAAQIWRGRVHAVVLTGMGSDGRAGAEQLYSLGATITAQDEATSVVWGMPGAVTAAGVTDAVLPLGQIAQALLRSLDRATLTGGRPA